MARATIPRTCENCGISFQALAYSVQKGFGQYCSRACAGIAKRTRIVRICPNCASPFDVKPGSVALGQGNFCSRGCRGAYCEKQAIRECEFCGEQFRARSKSRFCSRQCSADSLNKRADCVCENCQAEFVVHLCTVNAGGGRFCSTACRVEGIAREKRSTTLLARFQKYVDLTNTEGCLPWLGGTDEFGYGIICVGGGKKRPAHQVAFELNGGTIPEGHQVLHHCDNPPCCRPKHLFTGTIQDNARDRDAKGRQAKGEASGTAKLTNAQVLNIRANFVPGRDNYSAVGRVHGVGPAAIRRIISGEGWRHLLPDYQLTTATPPL